MTEQYTRTTWQNGVTPLNQSNLNNIEIGISNNLESISELKNDMKFKGVIDTLPSTDLEVGNVYQASVSGLYNLNKIGDLLVCTAVDPVSWHVIPSGDETSGTVTSVSAGTGLAGGTITGSGSIALDGNYTANEFRNGLLTKELYVKLRDIDSDLAINRDYSRLENVPVQIDGLQIKQEPGNSQTNVMSQAATTEALNTKSNVGHGHEISEIGNLSDTIAGLAVANHTHGYITPDGYFQDSSGTVLNSFLKTNNAGKISAVRKIPCSDIDGTTIGGVSIESLRAEMNRVNDILTPTEAEDLMSKAATENHSHRIFTNAVTGEGFVPAPPENRPGEHLLAGDGTWKSAVEFSAETAVINLIYPVGAYFETSSPTFDPTKKQWFETTTNTYVDADGDNREYAHDIWPGTWVLENAGLFHVSGDAANTAGYKCDLTTGANKADANGQNPGKGIKDGGEDFHLLTSGEAAQKAISNGTAVTNGAHSHSMNNIWSDGSGKNNAYKMDSKRKLMTRYTASAGGHAHTVTIPASNATTAHENRPPYVAVYRWHRVPNPPEPAATPDPGATTTTTT